MTKDYLESLKIYQMNDYDWIVSDMSLEETNDWYNAQLGLCPEEANFEGDVFECDKEKLKVVVGKENGFEEETTITAQEAIQLAYDSGDLKIPMAIFSSEWM